MRTRWLLVAALLEAASLSCQPTAEPRAPAPPPPSPAETLVAQWATALGGAPRLGQIQVIHRSADSLEDGLAGTREEWIGARLERREAIDHVHDRSLRVYDGAKAWLRDWNGQLQQLREDDLAYQVNQATLHGFAAVTGEAGPAEYLGEDPSGKLLKLRFHPAQGSAITYFLSKATFLPERAELPTFDQTLSVEFSEYREVNGLKVPFHERQADSVTTTDLHLTKVAFEAAGSADYTRPEAGPRDAFFLKEGSPVSVPFNFENNHILVETQLNGLAPIWFVLDTGADYTVINEGRLAEFHLSGYGGLKTEGGGNTTSGSYVEGVSQRVGGVEVRSQHAAVLPLRGLEKVFGMPLGGLLGYDFISRFVIEIDYPAKTLTFHDPARYVYPGQGASVQILLQGNQPYLREDLVAGGETLRARYILDVGAADTITLTTPFVKEHGLVERIGDRKNQVRKLAGSEKEFFAATTLRGRLDQVKLGPFTFQGVPINLSLSDKGAYASASFSGNIGEGLFSRFSKVIWDYSRDRMILEPGPELAAPFPERKTFGLTLLSDGPDLKLFRVTAVTPGSPAERAGLLAGDVITRVDDQPAAALTLGKLRELLSREGSHPVLTIQRSDAELRLPITVTQVPISDLR